MNKYAHKQIFSHIACIIFNNLKHAPICETEHTFYGLNCLLWKCLFMGQFIQFILLFVQ